MDGRTFASNDLRSALIATSVASREISQAINAELLTFADNGPTHHSQIPIEQQRPSATQTPRMAIKENGRILFIALSDVIAVEAQGNYMLLQREFGSFRWRGSISKLAARLKHFGFVRIHRSTLVNRSWVEEIRTRIGGEYLLRLRSGREFAVTRTYKRNLEALAELWLDNEDVC